MAGKSVPAEKASVRERLSQWDSLAALSERQKECFIDLGSTATSRPLPDHVSFTTAFVFNTIHTCALQLPVENETRSDVSRSLSSQLENIQNSQQVRALWYFSVAAPSVQCQLLYICIV